MGIDNNNIMIIIIKIKSRLNYILYVNAVQNGS